jgi:hypothetical protein
MDVPQNVQNLFKTIPKNVLLVGNGVLNNMGDLINSYEYVIRFNDFEIDGWEQHVGTKISAISLHCSDFTFPHTICLEKNYIKYRDSIPIFTTSPAFHHSKQDILHVQHDTKLLDVYKPLMVNPEVRLSSGATLALNLALFFNKKVNLIGFDFMKSGHYYDSNFSNKLFWEKLGYDVPAHSGDFEMNILKKIKNVKFL